MENLNGLNLWQIYIYSIHMCENCITLVIIIHFIICVLQFENECDV